jgi:hypothetical protein
MVVVELVWETTGATAGDLTPTSERAAREDFCSFAIRVNTAAKAPAMDIPARNSGLNLPF